MTGTTPNQQVIGEGSVESAVQQSNAHSVQQRAPQPGPADAPLDSDYVFCKKFTQYVSLITENKLG